MSFWEELRRRKVVRTVIAYLAAAFVTAQVMDLLVGALDLPASVLRITVLLLIAMLPLVLVVAWVYDVSGSGLQRTDSLAAPVRWQRVVPAAGIALIIFAAGVFFTLREPAQTLDANLVAVLPFRVSGSEIDYLSQGMVDLLAAKLTGEGGPRAADPRAVMNAQQQVGDDPNAIARAVGAGQVLTGSVVGTARQITLNATLTDVASRTPVQAELVGSTDTLPGLIDRLAAQLLSLRAGEGQRLSALASTSLPALRSYLTAQAAYRDARFDVAVREFARALEIDSTFALAAMGHILSNGWGMVTDTLVNRSERLLGSYLDRLGVVDRAMATALVGSSYPDRRSIKQKLAAWETALELAPDRADAWFLYGDILAHYGKLAERFGNMDEATQAFHRSLQLDSSHTPALVHLVDFAMLRGKADSIAHLTAIWDAHQASDDAVSHNYIARRRALGDSAGLSAIRAAMDTASNSLLYVISFTPLIFAGPPDDAIRAIAILQQRASLTEEKIRAADHAHGLYIAFGMPAKAAQALKQRLALQPELAVEIYSLAIIDALYANGDQAFATEAAARLDEMAGAASREMQLQIGCIGEQWKLWQGLPSNAPTVAAGLAQVPELHEQRENARLCALLLTALHANLQNQRDAGNRLQELDAVLRDGPAADETLLSVANMVASRLWERRGDSAGALRAITRYGFTPDFFLLHNSRQREEARLAALNGERQRAANLYEIYLTSHLRAEPTIWARDNAVRREFARLAADRD